MPIVSAIVGAIVGGLGLVGFAATVATFAITTVLAIGVSKLMTNRMGTTAAGAEPAGSRIQLPPATNNKLPVVYGSAFIGGSVVDAKISTDLQTMWYVIAMAEVTDTGTLSFDQLYYDNKLVTFGANGAVASLTTNTQGGGEVDYKVANKIFIYTFPDGSYSGTNTGGQSAIDIMSNAAIPANQRWTSSIYTSGGQSAAMTNTAFVIVKILYNQDAGTTSLGAITAKLINSLTKPGECIKDYLTNDRYGCAIPLANVDTVSLDDLDAYSDLPCYYTPMAGGPLVSQVRYRINGPLDTGTSCLNNLQYMVDACDSWLQYSELAGQWKVVINQSYTEAGTPFSDLYSVTSNNLIGGITISPTDLNSTYNQLEVQYPNTYIKDQTDYVFLDLFTDLPDLISQNEPVNKLTIQSQIINNFVQAKFIGIRRILQSREDLIISFQTDYSGIQTEAGDIVKVTLDEYGWTEKLFRVNNVIEEKYPDGSLGARLTAFEYNASIYDDNLDITDFIPEANTGLSDPNIISVPDAPIAVLDTANTIYTMAVSGNVSTTGLVRYLEFNYGNSANTDTHVYYTRVTNANGAPLVNSTVGANTVYTINATNIQDAGNVYWSVTSRNDQVGVRSGASNMIEWPGTGVTSYDPNTATGGVTFTNTAPNAMGKVYDLGWTMATGPRALIFENGANRANYYVPFYLDGVAIGTSYTDPYGQGTATTANGFYANSTGFWNPYNNSPRNLNINTDGWVVITYANWAGDNIIPGEALDNSISLGIITTTSPTTTDIRVQIAPFQIVPSYTPSGQITIATNFQKDLILPGGNIYANATFNFSDSYSYVIAANTTLTGYAMRNITPSTQIAVLQCDYKVQQRKL